MACRARPRSAALLKDASGWPNDLPKGGQDGPKGKPRPAETRQAPARPFEAPADGFDLAPEAFCGNAGHKRIGLYSQRGLPTPTRQNAWGS
jgi:hypothetical protein